MRILGPRFILPCGERPVSPQIHLSSRRKQMATTTNWGEERHRQNPREEREKEEEDTPERVIGNASNSKLFLPKRDI